MNTVPDKVKQLVSAQLFHDRKQNEERSHMNQDQKDILQKDERFRPTRSFDNIYGKRLFIYWAEL